MLNVLSIPSAVPVPLESDRSELKRPSSPRHASPPPPKRRAPSPSAALDPEPRSQSDAVQKRQDARPAGGDAAPGPVNCRLLWRGKVVTQEGQNLHGIAIIAHLFSVPSATAGSRFSPALAATSSLSPFDDPFSSSSNATASGADMCLGLEMLRGAPITATGEVRILNHNNDSTKTDTAQLPGSAGQKDRKGKGKAGEAHRGLPEAVEVETPTDVRVYIDDRCPETVDWFQDMFCREGRQGYGVRFNAGGEEVVIFANLPEANQTDVAPSSPPEASTSASTGETLPALTLLLGRPVRSKAPRPDDPMPRENLFAKKLRKTASLPASSFPTMATGRGPLEPAPPPAKRRRQSAKDRAIASLLGGSGLDPPKEKKRGTAMPPPVSRPRPRSASTQPPVPTANGKGADFAGLGLASLTTTSRTLSRSSSVSRFSSSSDPARAGKGPSRQTSLPPSAGLPLRRSSSVSAATLPPSLTTSSTGRLLKRSLSRSSMLLESPPGSDDDNNDDDDGLAGDDGELVDRAFARQQFRRDGSASTSASARATSVSLQAMFGSRAGSRAPASPTPSMTSLVDTDSVMDDDAGGDNIDDDDGENEERLDAVADLRAFAPGRNLVEPGRPGTKSLRSTDGAVLSGGRRRIARSSSLPVGQFTLVSDGAKGRPTTVTHRDGVPRAGVEPAQGVVPPGKERGAAPASMSSSSRTSSAIETRNKNTMKKIAMNRMDALGCGKAHTEFKDVFSLTTRGVAFAMRATFKTAPLSPEDRQRAAVLIDKHLAMYMPVESFPLTKDLAIGDIECVALGKPVPREVEAAVEGPPSPKSLGDNLDEPDPRVTREGGDGPLSVSVSTQPESGPCPGQVDDTQTEPEETQLDETQIFDGEGGEEAVLEVDVATPVDVAQIVAPHIDGSTAPPDAADGRDEDNDEEPDVIILVDIPQTLSSAGVDLATLG
ncbi:hypothetical protein JCM3774_001970 [Rhodotorula dairenensis]